MGNEPQRQQGQRTAKAPTMATKALTCLAVFVLGFGSGVLFHSHYPEIWSWHTARPDEVSGGRVLPPPPPPPPPTRAEPEELLAKLSVCVRNLTERQRELAREAKEGRIAYQLVRARGYGIEAPECERLVANQKRLNEAIAAIAADLSEARRLEAALHKVLDEKSTLPERMADREPLLRDARACVQKHKLLVGGGPVIPAEQWEGGPDSYMGSSLPDGAPAKHRREEVEHASTR